MIKNVVNSSATTRDMDPALALQMTVSNHVSDQNSDSYEQILKSFIKS